MQLLLLTQPFLACHLRFDLVVLTINQATAADSVATSFCGGNTPLEAIFGGGEASQKWFKPLYRGFASGGFGDTVEPRTLQAIQQ